MADFFKMLELDAADAPQHPDAFDRLRRGELHGIMVNGVYSPETLNEVVSRLERHDPPFLQTWFPGPFRSWFYGQNLNLAHPDLRPYFAETPRFHQQLQSLLPPGKGMTDYVAGILAQLDRGRPFRAPPGPGPGDQYMFTTIRAHLEGGFIPPHCDNEQAMRPSFRHLMGLIEPHLMSFVLAFTLADAGGALEIFNYQMPALGSVLMNDDRGAAPPDWTNLESLSVRIPAGSLFVVDSGRCLHRVTPVVGEKKRWAACSFLAKSRHGDATYCWG